MEAQSAYVSCPRFTWQSWGLLGLKLWYFDMEKEIGDLTQLGRGRTFPLSQTHLISRGDGEPGSQSPWQRAPSRSPSPPLPTPVHHLLAWIP